MRRISCKHPQKQSGITLIEILVTMVIVAIGLLGVAAMIINGLESNRSAYLRTQASNLAYDMADRIRTNRDEVDSYTGFDTDGASTAVPNCVGSDSGCSPADLATADKAQWTEQIHGANGSSAMLPGADGTIVADGDDVVITINWADEQWDEDSSKVSNQEQAFVLRFNL